MVWSYLAKILSTLLLAIANIVVIRNKAIFWNTTYWNWFCQWSRCFSSLSLTNLLCSRLKMSTLMPDKQKKANDNPPSPLDSGSASLLPPSAGAEYWWLPAPPPTWRLSESVKAPKTFHPTWLALSSSKSESQSSYKRKMFIRLRDNYLGEINRECHIESEIGHGIQYYTQWTD